MAEEIRSWARQGEAFWWAPLPNIAHSQRLTRSWSAIQHNLREFDSRERSTAHRASHDQLRVLHPNNKKPRSA
jgi:hypothetical protein